MTSQEVRPYIENCGKYIYTIYKKVTKQEFISNKIYFANILDEFVMNEKNSWNLYLHHQDIIEYWLKKEGMETEGFDREWMLDPIRTYLKRIIGIGIENSSVHHIENEGEREM